MEARIPDGQPQAATIKGSVCGGSPAPPASTDLGRMRARNIRQDVLLAALGSKDELKKLYGSCTAAEPADPEWYLRIRDYLFRLR